MKNKSSWKALFVFAGCFNLVGSLPYFVMPKMAYALYFTKKMQPVPAQAVFFGFMFWTIVFLFGLGYFLVAKHLESFPGIILLAAAGKIIIGVCLIKGYIDGMTTMTVCAGGIADVLQGFIFSVFLAKHKAHFSVSNRGH